MKINLLLLLGVLVTIVHTFFSDWPAPDENVRSKAKVVSANQDSEVLSAPRGHFRHQNAVSQSYNLSVSGVRIASPELRVIFDSYLDTSPGVPTEQARASLTSSLQQSYGPEQCERARELLNRYEEYRRELAGLERGLQIAASSDSAARANLIARLRERFLSTDESEGLFGPLSASLKSPDWELRAAAYREERDRLRNPELEMSEVDRQTALQSLRSSRFKDYEIALLVTID